MDNIDLFTNDSSKALRHRKGINRTIEVITINKADFNTTLLKSDEFSKSKLIIGSYKKKVLKHLEYKV